MPEAVNLPSARMECCSVSYNLTDQKKKKSTKYFRVLDDERESCQGKTGSTSEERLCFLGINKRDCYRKGII